MPPRCSPGDQSRSGAEDVCEGHVEVKNPLPLLQEQICLKSSRNPRLHHIHPVLNLSELTRTQDLLQSVLALFDHRVSDKSRPSARSGLGTELQRMCNVMLCFRLLPFCEQRTARIICSFGVGHGVQDRLVQEPCLNKLVVLPEGRHLSLRRGTVITQTSSMCSTFQCESPMSS